MPKSSLVSTSSCVLAVFAVLTWPLFNTFLSIWLAAAGFLLGIGGIVVARRSSTRSSYILSIIGLLLSGLVIVSWSFVIYVATSAARGQPM
jgi:hypothetical protein